MNQTQAAYSSKSSGSKIPLGLFPLLIAMPFMYWPKLLFGDTQPWVLVGAALSALLFWPNARKKHLTKLLWPILGACACAVAYILRESSDQAVLRYFSILITFTLLWAIALRINKEQIGFAVRISVAIWFVVGFYQVVGLRLDLPVEFFGRFIAARGGVPGLTAEPSFYGSISVVQVMLLLAERNRQNRPFIALAVASVFLSGSLLSYLMLIVPLARLRGSLIVGAVLLMLVATTQGLRMTDSGVFNRIAEIDIFSLFNDPMAIVRRDASTNLRFGHIIFSLYHNIGNSLFFEGPISFRDAYNDWAFKDGQYIYNGSDFILTSAGELIFRSGVFGLSLIMLIYYYSVSSMKSINARFEKFVFVTLCLLSPITLSNPFFILYLAQEDVQ